MHNASRVGGDAHASELTRRARLLRFGDQKTQEASATARPVVSVSPFERTATIPLADPEESVGGADQTFVEMAHSSRECNDQLEIQSKPIKCRTVKKVAVAALAVTCSVLTEIGLLILSPFLGAFLLARLCPCMVFVGGCDDGASIIVFLVIIGALLAVATLPFVAMSYVGAGIVFGKVMEHFPNLYPNAADYRFVRHCNEMRDDISVYAFRALA